MYPCLSRIWEIKSQAPETLLLEVVKPEMPACNGRGPSVWRAEPRAWSAEPLGSKGGNSLGKHPTCEEESQKRLATALHKLEEEIKKGCRGQQESDESDRNPGHEG